MSTIEGLTVLVVEDRLLSGYLKNVLTQRGCRVICLNHSRAQELLKNPEFGVDVLITNTPQHFVEYRTLPVLYVASCPDPAGTAAFDNALQLTKPFPLRQLLHCLEQLLS